MRCCAIPHLCAASFGKDETPLLTLAIILVIILIILWAVYGPITEGILDLFRIRSVYHGNETTRNITLTFDDGPDPRYTPQLLALLKKYEAKAVFFVIGEKAKAHPDLIRQILDEGHRIGNHTYHHVNSWFVPPWRLKKEIMATNQVIEAITGEPVRYFRSPWGRLTMWTHHFTKQLGMVTVLYSHVAKDWRRNQRPEDLYARVAGSIGGGAIVLLHDGGGAEGAPDNTLKAMETLLPHLKKIGLSCHFDAIDQGVKQLQEPKFQYTRASQRIIIPLWLIWERYFDHKYHVYPMSRLFRLSVVPWRFGHREVRYAPTSASANAATSSAAQGAVEAAATQPSIPAQEPDSGEVASQQPLSLRIESGSPMVEIHTQNITLQEFVHIESPERMAVYSLKVFRDSMHDVAHALIFDERFQEAKGVFGMTLLHRGVDRLGFHLEEVEPTPMNRWVTKLLVFIMVMYHPQGRKRLDKGRQEMRPKLVWMTREELIGRYYKGEVPLRRDLPQKDPE